MSAQLHLFLLLAYAGMGFDDNRVESLIGVTAVSSQSHSGGPLRVGGAHILAVHPGTPAEVAGIESGDVVARIEGRFIKDVAELEKWRPAASGKKRFVQGYRREKDQWKVKSWGIAIEPYKAGAEKNTPAGDDDIGPDGTVDLRKRLSLAGFSEKMPWGTLHDYVTFGTAARQRSVATHNFENIEGADTAAERRQKIASATFLIRSQPISLATDKPDSIGNVLTCILEDVRLHPLSDDADRRLFSGKLSTLTLSRAGGEMWFMNKDHQLQRCLSAADVQFVETNGGALYHAEARNTVLRMHLRQGDEGMREVARNWRGYVVDLVITKLSLAPPATWGYYRRKALVANNWNCDEILRRYDIGLDVGPVPDYFVIDHQRIADELSAALVSATLRRVTGEIVGSYKAR